MGKITIEIEIKTFDKMGHHRRYSRSHSRSQSKCKLRCWARSHPRIQPRRRAQMPRCLGVLDKYQLVILDAIGRILLNVGMKA